MPNEETAFSADNRVQSAYRPMPSGSAEPAATAGYVQHSKTIGSIFRGIRLPVLLMISFPNMAKLTCSLFCSIYDVRKSLLHRYSVACVKLIYSWSSTSICLQSAETSRYPAMSRYTIPHYGSQQRHGHPRPNYAFQEDTVPPLQCSFPSTY